MTPKTAQSAFTVLIVDDSSTDRLAFQRFLAKESDYLYKVIEAASGEAGLSQLEATPVDLILLDYSLPGLSGLEFLQRLKEHADLSVPVLMLTGQGDEKTAVQAIKAGAHDYIVKQPAMGDLLRKAVRTTLREVALQQEVSLYRAQQTLIQAIALRIRTSLDLQTILNQAVLEVRDFLECDRVIIYRFLPDRSGIVEVESVVSPWHAIKGEVISDTCFENEWLGTYLTGKTTDIEDIHRSSLASCHVALLERCQVRANLVVPIVINTVSSRDAFQSSKENGSSEDLSEEMSPFEVEGKALWGLLIAHQCDAPRQWNTHEVRLLRQLSDQLAIALQQSMLYHRLERSNQQLEANVAKRTAQLQQVNDSLLQVNQALIASNQDLEQFAYIASHDLREPLRKIKSFAELLAKRYADQLDETGDRYINYITNGAVRMQTLINDLLLYSRLGTRDLARVDTDFNQVLTQVLSTLSGSIAEQQAVIQADSLPTLRVDALQIEQLFLNLIENALKYSGTSRSEGDERADLPPMVTITARSGMSEKGAPEWTFSFEDNGIGIDAEFYDRIFVIFQRLHARSEYSGTGIGLAICQRIVERHSGKIGVQSVPGEGSTFWFTLPA